MGCSLAKIPVQGRWSKMESSLPINLLELRAVRVSLQHFGSNLKDTHVLVHTDNIATKALLNNQGGTRSSALHKETVILFRWAEIRLLSIQAEHVRGQDNVQADCLSRLVVHPVEWLLQRELFIEIANHFGYPEVDLFGQHRTTLP